MVASLTYRTADNTRWGGGQGSDLLAATIDLNFWTLAQAIAQLESDQSITVSIDYITVTGNQMYVTLTNHAVLGPFTLPTAEWSPRGNWAPTTAYAPFDVVSENGSLYLVTTAHTSAATFNVNATNGTGQALYVLILSAPENALPANGTIGQVLTKSSGSPFASEWGNLYVRLAVFVGGQPNPSETLLQYSVVDAMTLPVGLAGSSAYEGVATLLNVTYTLNQNGNAIGSITFTGPSPQDVDVTFPAAVNFIPGDTFTLVGPTTPDAQQADISFTIVATLT